MLEREIKLDVPATFRLESVAALGGGYRLSKIEAATFDSRYFDTSDLRLTRSGCSLRYRSGRGWTLKLPQLSEQGELARLELTSDASPRTPPPPLVDLATAYVRGRRVRPIATLRTNRRTVNVRNAGGTILAEIAEDDVRLLAVTGEPIGFRELEVELHEQAPPGLLVDLARRLQAAGAGKLVGESKIQRALGVPPASSQTLRRPTIGTHSSIGNVLRAELTARVMELQTNDASIRLGFGPEPLHVARVAARRLRCALRVFETVVDEAWAAKLGDEIEWLGNCLGAARDADVLVQRLREAAAHLGDDYGAQRTRFMTALHQGLDAKYRTVRRALRSPRYARLLERLVSAAAHPKFTPECDRPARTLLPELIAAQWRKLRKAASGADRHSPDAALHRIRILVRRCRYAVEAGAGALGPSAARFATRLARLQQALGEQHDAVVAQAYITKVAASARATRVGAALLEGERRIDVRCRGSWIKAWGKAKRAKFW